MVASTVFWKVMLPPVPLAVVLMATRLPDPFRVTARRKSTASEVVEIVREPVIATTPAPFCVTAPSEVTLPLSVSKPAFVKVTGPPPVVVSPAFTVCTLPVRLMPPAAFVFTAPFRVVVPVPADCVSVAALKVEEAVTLLAEAIVTLPRRVAPTEPVKVTLPVPAASVRSFPPERKLLKVMLPAPAPVLTATGPTSVVIPT